MKVWITRDRFNECFKVWGGELNKPVSQTGNYWQLADGKYNKSDLFMIHKTDIKKLIGFTPRKGSCKQYELSLKEIKT